MIAVSVVIPTHYRPLFLDRCLEALTRQDFDANKFEIIVVDDGGSEITQRLIAIFISRCWSATAGWYTTLRR